MAHSFHFSRHFGRIKRFSAKLRKRSVNLSEIKQYFTEYFWFFFFDAYGQTSEKGWTMAFLPP